MAKNASADVVDVEVLGAGPALVFIHGAGGSPRSNYPFLDYFALQHTVIAPHLPGVGATPLHDRPLSTAAIAEDIAVVLSDMGVGEYIVIGYSMGTTIAVELAAAHPDSVSAIVLTAGFVKAQPSLLNFVELWDALQDGPEHVLGRLLLAAVLKPETLDARGVDWIEDNSRVVARDLAPGTRAHLRLIRTLDVRDDLAATSQPLLVITPKDDRLVDPSHADEIMRARPDARQVVLACSHSVGDEAPDAWREAISSFLSAVWRGEAPDGSKRPAAGARG